MGSRLTRGSFFRTLATLTTLLSLAAFGPAASAQPPGPASKLDPLAREQAARATGWSRVILRAADLQTPASVDAAIENAGGIRGRALGIINSRTALVPNAALAGLARHPFIAHIALDREVRGTMERAGATIGATSVRQQFGYDGAGVGVAIVDSGVTAAHDDLSEPSGQRVVEFVDFVNAAGSVYDDYGHGTHVAGIVAGNGFDSSGARTGIAPGVHLVVLKALDASGAGRISDVIAALDHVITRKDALNIRVVNLSIAAGVFESPYLDPLTLAAKRVSDAGIVVVAAAGNGGRNSDGLTLYGGVTAPGNAPWVLTVGASNHNGTSDRGDDSVAVFSSRGPTGVTSDAKPDIVAPGVGIESLSAPDSTLYTTRATHSTVVWGSMVVWGTTVVWGSVCSDPVCDTIWNPDVR